jgi:hypothetical protein
MRAIMSAAALCMLIASPAEAMRPDDRIRDDIAGQAKNVVLEQLL